VVQITGRHIAHGLRHGVVRDFVRTATQEAGRRRARGAADEEVFEKTIAEMEAQLGETQWLACDRYTLADAEITPYIERVDRLGLAGLWENRPRVFDWFTRIKARPGFKGISDYPPTDYDDTGRDGLKHWTRIKELIAA
jgi:glutathione S-transferase